MYFSDKSDGIVRMLEPSGGLLASMEHKTGEWINDKWFDKYAMDGQVTGHVFSSRSAGYPVDGVVINAIQFNKLPEIKYKKDGHAKSCPKCKIPLDQCQTQHVSFARRVFTRSEAEIDFWLKQEIATALDYYKALIDSRMKPEGIINVPHQGLMHGKCARCDFKQFCLSGQKNLNLLVKRPPRDASVLSSGLYEVNDGEV